MLEKINCNDNFEKIHRSKIENFITVNVIIFSNTAMTR